jgi:undecaprenyl-diphosphatase
VRVPHHASIRRAVFILCLLVVALVASFRADEAVEQFMRDGQTGIVRFWAKRISHWGNWPVLFVAGTIGLGVAAWRRNPRVTRLVSIMILSSMIAGLTATAVHLASQRSFSFFPSAHTSVALAFLTPLLCAAAQRSGVVLTCQIFALLAAISIGWARVYLSVHHLSDVLGGAVLGTIIAMLVAGTRPGWHLRRSFAAAFTRLFPADAAASALPSRPVRAATFHSSPVALQEIEWLSAARSSEPRHGLSSNHDSGRRARFVTDAPAGVVGQN